MHPGDFPVGAARRPVVTTAMSGTPLASRATAKTERLPRTTRETRVTAPAAHGHLCGCTSWLLDQTWGPAESRVAGRQGETKTLRCAPAVLAASSPTCPFQPLGRCCPPSNVCVLRLAKRCGLTNRCEGHPLVAWRTPSMDEISPPGDGRGGTQCSFDPPGRILLTLANLVSSMPDQSSAVAAETTWARVATRPAQGLAQVCRCDSPAARSRLKLEMRPVAKMAATGLQHGRCAARYPWLHRLRGQ